MRNILKILLLLLFVSCNSINKWEGIKVNSYLSLEGRSGVFVCNEGNFMFGNASLSFYDSDSGEVFDDIFYNTNGFPLGDVCQSMTLSGDDGFVVMNNSGKVYVVDNKDVSYKAAIRGLVSPRYMKIISPTKAYITDLYSPSITVIDPKTYKITGYLFVGYGSIKGRVNGTEQMARRGDDIYTCSWSQNNKVYKIDSRIDKLVDSVVVTKQPNSIVVDKNGKLWVLSDGGYVGSPYGQENAALTRINGETLEVELVLPFEDIDTSPSRLSINSSGDMLYFINGDKNGNSKSSYGVYSMSVSEESLPRVPLIENGGRLIYALGVDPINEDIYIADAIDHTQSSIIYRYNRYGIQEDKFKGGITTCSFTFKSPSGYTL